MEALLLAPVDQCYENSVERAIEVHDTSPREPIRAGLEAAVEMAETDPEGTRAALWRLQGDWETLERLGEILGGEPTRATLRIGAIIHLVRAELALPSPQLEGLVPEILAWLESEN